MKLTTVNMVNNSLPNQGVTGWADYLGFIPRCTGVNWTEDDIPPSRANRRLLHFFSDGVSLDNNIRTLKRARKETGWKGKTMRERTWTQTRTVGVMTAILWGWSAWCAPNDLAQTCSFVPYEKVPTTSAGVATGCPEFTVDLPRPHGGRVVKAADYGFSPANDDNGAALQRAVAACRELQAEKLELAPGFYNCFGPEGVTFAELTDLTLDGKGAILIFRRPPRIGANDRQYDIPVAGASFVISNCVRMAIRDLNFDWDWERDPLADFATIEAAHVDEKTPNGSYIDFKMCDFARHPQYPNPVPVQTIISMTADHTNQRADAPFQGFYGLSEGHFGAKTAWVAPNVLRLWPHVKLEGGRYQHLYDANFTAEKNLKAVRQAAKDIGGTYRLAHRYYGPNAINTYGCRHLTLDRVDVWSCFGMGIRTSGPQQYWQVLNCHVRLPPKGLKRPDGRLYAPYLRGVTTTADANHVVASKGYVKFINCSWTMHQDDSHNFHDRSTLVTTTGPRRIAVVNERGTDYFGAAIGDAIELVQEDFTRTGWKGKIVAIDDQTYVVDRDLPRQTGIVFVVFSASLGTDNILLRNCDFTNTLWARSLFHGSNVTVEDCVCRNITGAPFRFQIEYTWNAWCEGYGSTNIVVRNCTFENDPDNYQAEGLQTEIYAGARIVSSVEPWIKIANPYLKKVLAARREAHAPEIRPCNEIVSRMLIENCSFLNPRGLVLQVMSGKDIVFRHNAITFDKPAYSLLPYAGSIYARRDTVVDVEDVRLTVSPGTKVPQLGLYRER